MSGYQVPSQQTQDN